MEDLTATFPLSLDLVVLPNSLGLMSWDGFSKEGIGVGGIEGAANLSDVRLVGIASGLCPAPSNLTCSVPAL